MQIDYSIQAEGITDAQLHSITELAKRLQHFESLRERAIACMDSVTKEIRKLAELDIPSALTEVGMKEFTLADGTKIGLKTDYYVSTTGKYRPFIMQWLADNDHMDLVKTEIEVEFGKGEVERAQKLFDFLEKKHLNPIKDTNVNAATFKALIRELIENPEDEQPAELPLEDLGVTIVKRATVSNPSDRKK